MPAPLLRTKLYIPPVRRELVPRPRLIERLNAGLHRKLTLISAPAGFGKTTLLSEWVAGCGQPVAWVSLDDGDNDPARFWAYFVAALQGVRADVERAALAMLHASGLANPEAPPSIQALLTGLINDIADIPSPLVLVLDDYHLIAHRHIHHGMTFLLDNLPSHMHLVLSSRSDPPWPLARLRARGEMTELRMNDLRFTSGEAAEFLNRIMGLKLTAGDTDALASRTEGWIAGLQMAAVSMQGREDVADFIHAFAGSNRYILDYLLEEVLQRQTDSLQTFLLETAILDRLTGPLCDAVATDIGDWRLEIGNHPQSLIPNLQSQAILEYLESSNLFVVPLDNERQWYRYHRLFADLLRKRLQQAHPDRVPTLHRRASRWYERNGLPAAAIDHALSAGDFERAAHLIDELAEPLWREGAQSTLSAWLAALPDEQVTSRPQLCVFHAMVLFMAGQLGAAELRLQAAERALGPMANGAAGELQGMVAATRALIAYFQGDVPAIIRFSRQALAVLPEEKATWRSSAAINLGDAYRWSGQLAAADRAYEEAVKVGWTTGNVFVILIASIKQAFTQTHQGRLRRAIDICRQLLQLVEENWLSQTPLVGGVFAVWGSILCEQNHLQEALRDAHKACELSEQGSSVGLLGLSYLVLLRILWARGDTAGAEETIRKLEKLTRESNVPVWIASGTAAWKAHAWMAQGNLAAAEQLLQERGLSVDDDLTYPQEIEYLSLARLLIAQHKLEEADRLLERLLQSAQAGGRVEWIIAVSALQALALQAQGDVDRALTPLERALALAEPEGYVRVFVDEGLPLARLLRHAASRGIAPEYASKLLAAMDASAPASTGEVLPPSRTQPLIDPLSERELEVLRLLVTHLSSSEIGHELFIAASTARSHIKSIYGKLHVHSRNDAVRRARELGLL